MKCVLRWGVPSPTSSHPDSEFFSAESIQGFTQRQRNVTSRVPVTGSGRRHEFLGSGYGITSLVRRATATVRQVAPPELLAGRRRLVRTVRTYQPRWVAVFGVGAYRTAFGRINAQIGQQHDALDGTSVWLLPSPSGANGSYPLVDLIRELRTFYCAVNQSELLERDPPIKADI